MRRLFSLLMLGVVLSVLGLQAATSFPSRTDFRDETIYFVMTTRFYDGDESNNAQCWDGQQYNQGDPAWRGDFKGLIEKLDYIKALGFTAIWITPVVENASGYDYHGYHASDMSKVDHRYESEDVDFQDLIDAAHDRGMKVVLDIVLNHTGNFGEANLCKLFDRDWDADQSSIDDCMIPFTEKDGGKLPDNYLDLPSGEQYWHRLRQMKNHDGANHDVHNLWHHFGNFNWDNETRWWAQIAGDCVDLNTENPRTYNYLLECYTNFIKMGVDGFRIDTGGHIPRLVFNKVFAPKFNEAAEIYKSARNDGPFFMFTEVCARYTQIWYREQPALSVPFYTWKESKEYAWDESESSWDNLVIYESTAFSHTNQLSCLAQYNDNGSSSINSQPTSDNVFLKGNTYHTPDYSKYSGLSVIDFPMHHNFKDIGGAWGIAMSGDKYYNDASYNVVYVDSHDYAPNGAPEDQRFAQGTDAWAENLSLMFTFRGIPCLYYGSEIEFKKGCTIDKGPNMALKDSGRAYFGGYIKGDIDVTDFAEYSGATGNINATLNYPLALHIQRLNKIRMAIPALRKGQYSTEGCSGKYSFKRRYTDSETDSYVLVTISGNSTFTGIENGTYVDAITGDTQTVSNGTLTANCSGKGNMRVYVLSTSKTKAPGKIGEDGKYLYTTTPASITQPAYDGTQEELADNDGTGNGNSGNDDPETVITPSVNEGEQCVFFEKPSNWGSSVYTYVYYTDASGNTQEVCGGWPGKKSTSLGNSVYKYTFPEGTATIGTDGTWYVLFNDGSGNQTAGDPGFVCEQAGYYTMSGLDHIVTEAGSDPGTDPGTNPGTSVTPTVNEGEQCVFFESPSGWGSTIYAYIYYADSNSNVQEICGSWPGKTCTLLGDNVYKYTFPEGTATIGTGGTWYILFNDGGNNQTAGDPGFVCKQAGYYTISGLDHIVTDTNFVKNVATAEAQVFSFGGSLYIIAPEVRQFNIYSIDGRCVLEYTAEEGRNVINSLEPGIYIVDHKKVLIK